MNKRDGIQFSARATEDWEKRRARARARNASRDVKTGECMKLALEPCPECGMKPTLTFWNSPGGYAPYKFFCPIIHASEIFISRGGWHTTIAKAARSWNGRARNDTKGLDERLRRIPKRENVFAFDV